MSSVVRGPIWVVAVLVVPMLLALSAAVPVGTPSRAGAQEAPPDVSPAGATDGPAADILEPDLGNPFSWTFSPKTLTVPVGATVTWTNRGVIGHTVTAADLSWDSDVLLGGGTYQRTFDVVGEVAYYCRIHPWATATLIVAPAEATGDGDLPAAEPVADGSDGEGDYRGV